MFLSRDELATLTGIRTGRGGRPRGKLQAEQLARMGIPHWINARGDPVVACAAIEGRPVANRPESPDSWSPAILKAA